MSKRFIALFIIALFSAASPSFGDQSKSGTQSAVEEQARYSYMVGQKAFDSGDFLTAAVRWAETLQLKPSSEHTVKMLDAAKKNMSPNALKAFSVYLAAADASAEGKIDDAEKQFQEALYLQPGTACIENRICEIADIRAKARRANQTQDNAITIRLNGTRNVQDLATVVRACNKALNSNITSVQKRAIRVGPIAVDCEMRVKDVRADGSPNRAQIDVVSPDGRYHILVPVSITRGAALAIGKDSECRLICNGYYDHCPAVRDIVLQSLVTGSLHSSAKQVTIRS